MQIKLHNIVPIPLREKLTKGSSDIWNKQIVFEPNQFVKIIAPSGTGKTTLVHQLYALRKDYVGDIFYQDKNIKTLNAEEIAVYRQQQISIIFQDLRLLPQLTALENIELKRKIYPAFVSETEMYNMIETLGISHILQQSANICSYGEQQRIAIVRALMQPFNVLIMDEPFSHLDYSNTTKAAALITEACVKRSASFILTDLEADNIFNYTNQYKL